MRLLKSICALLLAAASVCAQAPATDYLTHAVPSTPALPGVGGTFTDSTYGSTYLQLTSVSEGRGDCDSVYSYWPSAAPDDSKVFALCWDGVTERALVKSLNTGGTAITGTTIAPSSVSGAIPAWGFGFFWLDSDNLLVLSSPSSAAKLLKWTISTNTLSVYKDFTSLFTGGDGLRQIFMSTDRDVLSANWVDSSSVEKGYIAIRLSTLSVLKQVTNAQVNEAHLDKSGRFMIVDFYDTSLITVHDLTLNTTVQLTQGTPNFAESHHAEFAGFSAGGNANWDGGNCHFATGRSLLVPTVAIDLMPLAANDCSQGQHSSNGADANTWMLNSTYGLTPTGMVAAPFRNELYLVKLDGTGAVYRFAHHFNSQYATYYDSPRAALSNSGRLATFTTNWGVSGGHRDVILVNIPNSPIRVPSRLGGNIGVRGSGQIRGGQ
jgi:hypothetical protein